MVFKSASFSPQQIGKEAESGLIVKQSQRGYANSEHANPRKPVHFITPLSVRFGEAGYKPETAIFEIGKDLTFGFRKVGDHPRMSPSFAGY